MKAFLNRRRFLQLGTAFTAGASLRPTEAQRGSRDVQSLAGQWRFALDRDDSGMHAESFRSPLRGDAAIALPGILQTQGFGDKITATTPFVAALPRDMRWYLLPQYEKYALQPEVEVPYLSQPVRHYLGVAWYEKEIAVPASWAGKHVALFLERTRWRTDIFLDGVHLGSNQSLVAPHEFALGILPPGSHRLTLRIDNRMQQPAYRPDGHSVSDAEGSTWNGVVGRIELTATSPVWIDDAQVFPEIQQKRVRIRVRLRTALKRSGKGELRASGVRSAVAWDEDGGEAEIVVPTPKARLWSEDNPALEQVLLSLHGSGADDAVTLRYGFREIATRGTEILVNGDLLNFRATHDGGGFPLTGYPATDVETWKRIMTICKSWGFNGMRFHSWCPPEAAFTAADELGLYLQAECGMWNAFDTEGKMLQLLNDETAALLRAFGNHPSLLFLGATNEPAGHYNDQLPSWCAKWRAADPRRLYTDGVGRPAKPPVGAKEFAADYITIGGPARGPAGWFGGDYEEKLASVRNGTHVPVIGHEIGQWCAYPDYRIIDKFSGKRDYVAFPRGIDTGHEPYMVPGNYRIMRDDAAEHNVLSLNAALAHASGRFQLACYKEELEANHRSPTFSGYQILDLHDYLGQGGALVGMLDAFWEPKGYTSAAEFRRFNAPTVPLARLNKRVYAKGENLDIEVELAHFGTATGEATAEWHVESSRGVRVASGAFPPLELRRGKGLPLGRIKVDTSLWQAPEAYTLSVTLPGIEARNDWRLWLYPATQSSTMTGPVVITSSWADAQAALDSGGRVLFLAGRPVVPVPDLALTSTPIFWNRLMNNNRAWMLGLLCQNEHPALGGFPTEACGDWQWADLLRGTTALRVDLLSSSILPIVLPIDDWNRNLRLAMLFEVAVGEGRLMITSFDLSSDGLAQHVGAATLLSSLTSYMQNDHLAPASKISLDELGDWIPHRFDAPWTGSAVPQKSPDLIDPGQTRQHS